MRKLKDIFQEVGRPCLGDRRSYYYKAVEDLMNDYGLYFKMKPLGRVWMYDGKQCNLKILIPTGEFNEEGKELYKVIRCYHYPTITPQSILTTITKRFDWIKSIVNIKEQVAGVKHSTCNRCLGTGKLPHFSHICEGICFKCLGSGYAVVKTVLNSK